MARYEKVIILLIVIVMLASVMTVGPASAYNYTLTEFTLDFEGGDGEAEIIHGDR